LCALNSVTSNDEAFFQFVEEMNAIAAQLPIPTKPRNKQFVAMFLMLTSK